MTNAKVKREIVQYGYEVLKGEKFVECNGYPNYYISNMARVWSSKRHIFLTPRIDGKIVDGKRVGYDFVGLKDKNNKWCNVRVHRLVGLHFIPNPNRYYTLDHINDNKRNNEASNLQWITLKANLQKQHCKPVEVVDLSTGVTTKYNSVNEVMTVLKISTVSFYKLTKGIEVKRVDQIEIKYI